MARSDVRPDRIRSSQLPLEGVSRLLDKVAGLRVPTSGQVAGALAVHDPGYGVGPALSTIRDRWPAACPVIEIVASTLLS